MFKLYWIDFKVWFSRTTNPRSILVPLRGKKLGYTGERQEEMTAIAYWYYYPCLSLLFQPLRLRIWMLGFRVSRPTPAMAIDYIIIPLIILLKWFFFVQLSFKYGTISIFSSSFQFPQILFILVHYSSYLII